MTNEKNYILIQPGATQICGLVAVPKDPTGIGHELYGPFPSDRHARNHALELRKEYEDYDHFQVVLLTAQNIGRPIQAKDKT